MYGTDVTSIGIGAFYNFDYLEVVTIPDTVKEIGAGAFSGCENLYCIGNADNVQAVKTVINASDIGVESFRDCISLSEIELNNVKEIGDYAFFNCSSLNKVVINGDPNNDISSSYINEAGEEVTVDTKGARIGEAAFCGNLIFDSDPKSNNNQNIYGDYGAVKYPAPRLRKGVELNNIGEIDKFAFNGSGMTKVEIPEGVKIIGKAAFAFCTDLQTVKLPATLERLEDGQYYNPGDLDREKAGDGAFSCCKNLSGIEIPESVNYIGSYTFAGSYDFKKDADTDEIIETGISSVDFKGKNITKLAYGTFKDCKKLEKIVLPSALVELEGTNYADTGVFAGCTALKYVVAPECLETIGVGAFKDCESLEFIKCNPMATTNAEVSKSLVSIGDCAFENCKSLAAEMPLWLPDTLVSIGWSAFKNCEALTLKDNNISKELTELLDSAFENCTSLTAVNIPEKVTVISSSAFKNSGLVSVMIPSTVAEIKNSAFEQCAALEKLETEAGNGELIVYYGAFRESRALKDIVLARNTVTLQDKVFEYCTSLADVYTAKVDTINIGNDSFAGCTSLATSGLRKSITASFGARAYKGSGLTSFTVPDNVTALPEGMFMGCTQLAEVNLNSGLIAIRSSESNGTFQECTALKTISLPSGLSEIEAYAFTKSGLENITLPDSVTVINMDVFAGCSQLYSVKLGSKTTTICGKGETGGNNENTYVNDYTVRGAFRDCTALESIEFPSTVTDIQPFAFTGSGLKSVVLPEKLADLKMGVFYKCASLENIVLNNKLKNLFEFSLAECTALSEMEIPGTVTLVNTGAFKGDTSLETVRIGDADISKVPMLGTCAFEGCTKLLYVIFSGKIPPYKQTVFGEVKPTILYINHYFDENDDDHKNWKANYNMIPIDDMYEYEQNDDGSYSIKSYKGDLPVAIIPAAVSDADGNNVKITAISAGAFDGEKIKAVSIPKSVKDIDNSIFFGIENLERINVSALNNDYISVDGVLYANAGTTLVYCPQKKTGKFEIDKKVTAVEPGAFYSNSLTSFAVEDGNTVFGTVDGVLVSNGTAKIVAYPNGKGTAYTVGGDVTEIADYAFTGDNMIISFETLTAPTINANSIPANTVLKVYPDAVGFDGEAYAEYIVVTKDKPIIDKMEKTGENTVKVSYKNYKEGKIAGKTFAALYSGGEFVELTPQQDISLEVDAETEKTFEFTQTGDTVKIFIWKSLDKMEPIDENGTIGLN